MPAKTQTSRAQDGENFQARRATACTAVPHLGAKVLFFSGGSALDGLSRELKRWTAQSIHLVTPFDSGGSSGRLRDAFDMLSLGDLRSRLVSLADDQLEGCTCLGELLCHRLSSQATASQLHQEMLALLAGNHALVLSLPPKLLREAQRHLSAFVAYAPHDFDLSGANIGNLMLAGCYLKHGRELDFVLQEFQHLLGVQGVVSPCSHANAHLAVRLQSGQVLAGQAEFSGKYYPEIDSPILDIFLVRGRAEKEPVSVAACPEALKHIARADLICYPMGSFYSSVLCHFLVEGVVTTVRRAACPKVYVANVGRDPEQRGLTLADSVGKLIEVARKWVPEIRPREVIEYVLLDSRRAHYDLQLDVERLSAWGVSLIDCELARAPGRLEPDLLCRALLSLCPSR